jgi:hypothetical protein
MGEVQIEPVGDSIFLIVAKKDREKVPPMIGAYKHHKGFHPKRLYGPFPKICSGRHSVSSSTPTTPTNPSRNSCRVPCLRLLA